MKEIDKLLEAKNTDINLLRWENERLREKIKELENDIEKYKGNEVNRI
jgi:cell division septum initiation protein DivIVA